MLWPQSILPGVRHIVLWNSSSMAIVLFCFSLSLLSFYTFFPHVFHLCTLDSYLTKVYLVWIFPLNSRPINTIIYLTTPPKSYKGTSYLKYPRSNSWSPSKDSCLDHVSHLSWWYQYPTNHLQAKFSTWSLRFPSSSLPSPQIYHWVLSILLLKYLKR